ncbi:hypothetical protein FHS43_006611 [Streptosporangium becharense]|uniref:Uncharacterized protein n=1 Tax=Streptosporangium becharense TaxID=1816182 RepID=A0A7W9IB70_9ACTN|nr:hypothetical protein [Streptosporangium becharense]MBB5817011.1 hypothetical protein [Streptosporangium becharense]
MALGGLSGCVMGHAVPFDEVRIAVVEAALGALAS